jgi:hypothetical protein
VCAACTTALMLPVCACCTCCQRHQCLLPPLPGLLAQSPACPPARLPACLSAAAAEAQVGLCERAGGEHPAVLREDQSGEQRQAVAQELGFGRIASAFQEPPPARLSACPPPASPALALTSARPPSARHLPRAGRGRGRAGVPWNSPPAELRKHGNL